jgi:dUTP pyrophosphatase
MYVYLATPIDQGTAAHADLVRSLLIEEGHTVYAPYRAWGTQKIDGARLQNINQYALLQSDVVFAINPAGVATVGVPMEIQTAINYHMPVVLLTDLTPNRSAMVAWLKEQPQVAIGDNPETLVRTLRTLTAVQVGAKHRTARWYGEGQQPKVGKPGDAGFDLYYCDDTPVTIQPGDFVNVRSKIAVEFPTGIWGMIVGRSSTFSRRLFVAPSVIDNGYRGELYACCWNIGSEPQTINPGDRVAQIVPFPLTAESINWVNAPLSDSERGSTGFGSTGR